MVWLALLLCAAPNPLSAARAHLKSGAPDALIIDLADDAPISLDQRAPAAALLVEAAAQSRRKHDGIIALQLAQMAHRRDEKNVEALHLLGELALDSRDDAEAERWCTAWQALLPESPTPALLRLRIAADEGDWDTVHALGGSLVQEARLSRADQRAAREILAKAPPQQPGIPVVAHDDAIHQAAEAAARDRELAFAGHHAAQAAQVVVYGTSWCGFCKKARAYFSSRHIAFEDKDIERDRDAKTEMVSKLRAAGMVTSGVPVLDVHGTIIEGFNVAAIDKALAR